MAISKTTWQIAKLLIFLLSLLPLLVIVVDIFQDNLGANPIEELHFRTGDWGLRFLLITLSLTPMKLLFNINFQQRFRRMMGLFAFFYLSLHMLVYGVLDQSLSWTLIVDDVPKSPYVIVGLLAYTLLIPLAVTSTKKMMQRLGRHWKRLHKTVYLVAVLGLVHFFWLVKADLSEPLIYAAILSVLLGIRIVCAKRKIKMIRLSPASVRVR